MPGRIVETWTVIRFNDWTFDRELLLITRGPWRYKFNSNGGERKHMKIGTSGRFVATEHIVLSGGRATRKSLFDRLYEHDPNGGPAMGTDQIDVMLHNMKELIFPKLGVILVGEKRGGDKWYTLKPFSVTETAQKIRDVVRPTA